MVSDVRAVCDKLCASRINEASALKLAYRKNREALTLAVHRDLAHDGRPVPLFFVIRVTQLPSGAWGERWDAEPAPIYDRGE
jgi:hypothetical protein